MKDQVIIGLNKSKASWLEQGLFGFPIENQSLNQSQNELTCLLQQEEKDLERRLIAF